MRIDIVILCLFVFGTAALGVLSLISHGFSFFNILKALVYATPLFLTAVVAAAPVWVGLAIGGLAFCFSVPLPVFQRMEIAMLICMVIAGAVILQSAFKRSPRIVFSSTESALMLIVAISAVVRFLYDRPGSAHLGEFGGLGEAVGFVLGVCSYFVVARIAAGDWDTKRNLGVVVAMAAVGTAVVQVVAFTGGWWSGISQMFSRQVWLLSSLLLAREFSRHRESKSREPPFGAYLVIALTLLLSIVSPHRSRPLYACGIILGVALVYGYVRKWAFAMSAVVFAFLLYVMVAGSSQFPLLISRSLSTILPVSQEQIEDYARKFGSSSEYGWRSPFRTRLYDLAWREIREHPLLGKGFVVSREEVISAVGRSRVVSGAIEGLAMSGSYHNSVVQLAVFCGIPTALIFVVVWFSGVRSCIRLVPAIADRHLKILGAGILGFLLATSGQMFLNGGSRDFFYVCVLLGAIRGISIRVGREEKASQNIRI